MKQTHLITIVAFCFFIAAVGPAKSAKDSPITEQINDTQLGICPVGTILPFVGKDKDLPSNWVLCIKGAKVPKASTYSGTIPDLNDRFLYGTSSMKSVLKSGGSSKAVLKHNHAIASLNTSHDKDTYQSGKKTQLKGWSEAGNKVVYGMNQKGHGDIVRLKTDGGKTNEKDVTMSTVPPHIRVRFILRVR